MNSYRFATSSEALPVLCSEVMLGDEVGSRNGRTMELSPVHIELTEPWKREILVPGRKASLPAQIAETMWVLSGRNDIEWLSHYLPRAAEFSDDGETWRGGYGPRLRSWGKQSNTFGHVDQLAEVVELLKKDPLSRRAVISIYDPAVDNEPGKDIPCNNWLHFMNRLGKLDLHVAIRSNDLMWGWSGINAFEWSVLQEIVAKALGVQVGSLHFNISSLHLYDKHWSKAENLSEATSIQAESPTRFQPEHLDVEYLDGLTQSWFQIEEKIRKGERPWPGIDVFPEPMMQEWLRVIAWHWDGNEEHLKRVGEHLRLAAQMSPGERPLPIDDFSKADAVTEEPSPFIKYVSTLHAEKHAAYGDSWKKRGEMLGIMANIARKIDRLGVSDDHETAADTAIDLLVYLCKYRWWLWDDASAPAPTHDFGNIPIGEEGRVTDLLEHITYAPQVKGLTDQQLNTYLNNRFDFLENCVAEKRVDRYEEVDAMLAYAYVLASRLYWKQGNATRKFEYPS